MFIHFPQHSKLINIDSIDRMEIHENSGTFRLVLYLYRNNFNHNSNRNNNDGLKFVVAKSISKDEVYKIWNDILDKLQDIIVVVEGGKQ